MKKLISTVLAILLLFAMLPATASDYFSTGDEPIADESLQMDEYGAELVEFLMNLGYKLDDATEIQGVLNQCGIMSIELRNQPRTDVNDGLMPIIGYANGDKKLHFHFTTDNGKIFYCAFRGDDLYNDEKGGFIKKIGDVHIPETEVDYDTFSKLQQAAIKAVSPYLNYPDSASFGLLNWRVGREDDKYYVGGRVTAQNAFGMSREISFGVWLEKDGKGYLIEGIQLDGQRVK